MPSFAPKNPPYSVYDYLQNGQALLLDKPVFAEVISFTWGKSSNLICFCIEQKTEIKFAFSIFRNNQGEYFDGTGEFDFETYKDKIFPSKPFLKLTFHRTAKNLLICESAEFKKCSENTQNVINPDIIFGESQKLKKFLADARARREEWNREKRD